VRKLGSLALAASLATSLLVPAAAAAAPDDTGQDRFRSLAPPAVAPSQMPVGEGTEEREYFVRLAGEPAALYTGGVEGLEPTVSEAEDGTLDFQAQTEAARSYESFLLEEQAEVLTDGAQETIDRQLEPLASYTVANHGFAAVMTPAEARELANLPEVTWVQEFPEYELHTDRGPAFVNADGPVWNRPEAGAATGTLGEGVVVGVIDTGINPSSPSFAEESADGYVHENPRDRFYGSCDPTNVPDGEGEGVVLRDFGFDQPDGAHYDEDLAELCNGKLIGMWGYHSVTGSPIDYNGHGSHTAGTAAGGFADDVSPASLEDDEGEDDEPEEPQGGDGSTFDVSGVAPRANIISYAACCSGVGLVSSIDQAIVDGVDVINFSIGSTSPTANLLQDALTVGFLVARHNGVHVANSAGNAGPNPGTIGSPSDAPWLTSVASSTHDRLALKELTLIGDGLPALEVIEGKGVSDALETPTEIVYAGDHGNELCRWNDEDDPEAERTWDEDTFDGEIVICDRGQTGRVEKSQVAAAAGAGGFVLANDEINSGSIAGSLNGDSYPIPGLHITYEDGLDLKARVDEAEVTTATISDTVYDVDDRWGGIVSIFSSRGPNVNDASLMAPQVTAPGMDILAPYGSDDSTDYQFISGTSMSGPHVAGAFALLVDGFDDALSASEAQSALQLTANRDVFKTDGETPADPYDVGSGHIDVDAALASGLVLDVDTFDYIGAVEAEDTASLNVSSLAQGQCVSQCTWERTFTAPAGVGEVTWQVDTDATGFTVDADQGSFTLSGGESVTVTFTADVADAEPEVDLFGSVELTPSSDDVSSAHLPVIVRPSAFSGPERLDLVSRGYSGSEDVEFVAADAPDLQVDVAGLAPGEVDDLEVPQDPSPNQPFSPADELTFVLLDVPEDASRLVARIGETTSPDIDLFVGRDDNEDGQPDSPETLCVSAAGGSAEYCDIEDPAPGVYWVLVQNWEASEAGVDPVELITAVVAGEEGNLDVDAPASVGVMETFTVGLEWDLEAPTKHWFGHVTLGSDADDPDEYPVAIDLTVEPLVADAGGPYDARLGDPLRLDGSGSNHADGVPIQFEWDVSELGINTPVTGERPTITPTVAGTHEITLTVTSADDESATDTTTAVVRVPGERGDACTDAPPSAGFPDIGGNEHEDNIECLNGFGIAQGRDDGSFAPARPVNREQMASFVARMMEVAGVILPAEPESDFPDLRGNVHDLAIRQLADLDVVRGRPNGNYNPLGAIRRDQTAALMVRALEHIVERRIAAPASPFTDVAGNEHRREIDVAYDLGIVRGRTESTFQPALSTRRDQMASLIARTLDHLDLEGVTLTPIED
jgi:subtilisin family serine protease